MAHVKVLAILDKAEGYVYGLGGRDITPEHFKDIYARLTDIANGGELGPVYIHLGQRG